MISDRESLWVPGKLWSLWDMLERKAHLYLALGQKIGIVRTGFMLEADGVRAPATADDIEVNDQSRATLVGATLQEIADLCDDLGLPTSSALVASALRELPRTGREFGLIMVGVRAELAAQRFFFVPPEKASYYEANEPLNPNGMSAFPSAAQELRQAGNAYAADLPTASVYHSMRALEYALVAFAADLDVTISTESWHGVLTNIENAIKAARNGPNSVAKNERLQFLSEAANEFRYFKDGWRNYASHVKVTYDDSQAVRALQHVRTFIELLSTELKEAL